VGFDPADTPGAHGPPLFDAIFKREPEDFCVEEELALEPGSAGEHLWIFARKRLLDTADVVALLQRVYTVGSADVGVSGLKDRRAVTEQWFSVRSPLGIAPLDEALAAGEPIAMIGASNRASQGASPHAVSARGQVEILRHVRHGRKLRRGSHRANRFAVVLRDIRPRVAAGDPAAVSVAETAGSPEFRSRVAARVRQISELGFPNFFGPQRFGRDGRNVERALQHFRQPRKRLSRTQRSLYLSAARSALFNRVLAARVREGSWLRLQVGEPAVLAGSQSFFMPSGDNVEPAAGGELRERLALGDIHPSAPWWGRGKPLATGACLEQETALLADAQALREGLEQAGLDQARRATRVLVGVIESRWLDDRSLGLRFSLPSGTFATSLLAELGVCVPADSRVNNNEVEK